MFTRIVVPLDGSPFAETALAPARVLAKRFGARLLLVRAEPATGLPQIAQRAKVSKSAQEEWRRLADADTYLHQMVERLRAEGYDTDFTLFVSDAGNAIAQAAKLNHSDTIVMASHPRWTLPAQEQEDIYSTALAVFAHSQTSLLIWRAVDQSALSSPAPADLTEFAGSDMPIVVPLDGSRLAEAALPYAQALARAFDSSLVLTQIVPPQESQTDTKRIADYLQSIREDVARSDEHATTVVQVGVPVTGIEMVWRQSNAGLIVMASHGASGAADTFLGSVAARLIAETTAPVLVIQPHGPAFVGAADHRESAYV